MSPRLRDLELQVHETDLVNVESSWGQVPSREVGHLSHQRHVAATHTVLHDPLASSRNACAPYHETYKTWYDHPPQAEWCAAVSGESFRRPTVSSADTTRAIRGSDTPYSILGRGEPSFTRPMCTTTPVGSTFGPHAHTQRRVCRRRRSRTQGSYRRAVDRYTTTVPKYSPMERWKRESFRDSPWHNIDHDGRVGFNAPRVAPSMRMSISRRMVTPTRTSGRGSTCEVRLSDIGLYF